MGNLLTYSGLTTKVRAMESRFFTERQYEELASLATVGDALEFIKSQPAYGEVLASADSSTHRSELEKLLLLSRYRDFEKLYRFAGPGPRKFLSLYFSGFEIALLKRCLRSIAGPEKRPGAVPGLFLPALPAGCGKALGLRHRGRPDRGAEGNSLL